MTEQDKQALIEYYCQRDCGHTRKECCLDNCHEIMLIEEFPITPTDSDTISRQAAIDTVLKCYDNNELFEVYERELKELPSAEPEIVRCKNCKHWIPYDWMFSEVWQSKNIADYPEDEIGCNFCDMAMKANDFCSRGERREDG